MYLAYLKQVEDYKTEQGYQNPCSLKNSSIASANFLANSGGTAFPIISKSAVIVPLKIKSSSNVWILAASLTVILLPCLKSG